MNWCSTAECQVTRLLNHSSTMTINCAVSVSSYHLHNSACHSVFMHTKTKYAWYG